MILWDPLTMENFLGTGMENNLPVPPIVSKNWRGNQENVPEGERIMIFWNFLLFNNFLKSLKQDRTRTKS